MPSCGKAAASTALPQPPNTSQKVPKNSATSFRDINPSYTINLKLGILVDFPAGQTATSQSTLQIFKIDACATQAHTTRHGINSGWESPGPRSGPPWHPSAAAAPWGSWEVLCRPSYKGCCRADAGSGLAGRGACCQPGQCAKAPMTCG